MAVRKAEAVWNGNLQEGKGTVKLDSGAFEGAYSYASRFQEGTGTNPEELIGAAHAGCFSITCEANVPGVDQQTFSEQVEASKKGCPVSKALTGVEISVDAKLVS
jgi:osmotically inducible protein OsmC